MNRIASLGLILVLVLVLAPAPVLAQQNRGDRPVQREQMERRIRQLFGEQVRVRLGLTDEQIAAVQEVQLSFQEQRRRLLQRETALRRDLSQLSDDVGAERAQAMLREMAAVRADEARLFQAEMDALLRTLTPEQVVRFYRLRDDLMERVRRVRGQGPVRPLRGPAGPPPRGLRVALTAPLAFG